MANHQDKEAVAKTVTESLVVILNTPMYVLFSCKNICILCVEFHVVLLPNYAYTLLCGLGNVTVYRLSP